MEFLYMELLKEKFFEHNKKEYHLMLIKENEVCRIDVFVGGNLLLSKNLTKGSANDSSMVNGEYMYSAFEDTVNSLKRLN